MIKNWLWEKFQDFIEGIYEPDYGGYYGGGVRLFLMILFFPLWILYKILKRS